MSNFKIYIFNSKDFKSDEYRFGTTQITDHLKFADYWNKKFTNVSVKYFSDNIPIIKISIANKMVKKHVDKSFRIFSFSLNDLTDTANIIKSTCQEKFYEKEEKQTLYVDNRLRESETIKKKSYLDDISDDEEYPTESDLDFVASEEEDDEDDDDEEFVDNEEEDDEESEEN
jgi:hypothetical protein